jgi:hypothetical protein
VEKLDCVVSSKGNVKKDVPLKGFSLLEMKLLDIIA